MKKLKLNFSNLKETQILTRAQLKKVVGGDFGTGDVGCTTAQQIDCETKGQVGEYGGDGKCICVDATIPCTNTCTPYQECGLNSYCFPAADGCFHCLPK